MSFSVRDGKFDVVVVAGPRVSHWPTIGSRAISSWCAEMGLAVGVLGGESLSPRGVIPVPGTGGIVLVEDSQSRIHRLQARAVVRVSARSEMPDPFAGWWSQGMVPLSTAQLLRQESEVTWGPATAILGTGNSALRFGSSLLDSGIPEVYCIEPVAQWGAKRVAGWEVERRRFEMAGGRLIEAKPIRLSRKDALIWQLRLEDSQGVRVLEVARVVAAGPFAASPGVVEFPAGSFLYELEQTAALTIGDDAFGWALEEERAKWLSGKIIKALALNLGTRRESVDRVYRRARARLKRYKKYLEEPYTPSYQGKWMAGPDARALRAFSGVPQSEHKVRPMASVECIEKIACTICQEICPVSAIDFNQYRLDKKYQGGEVRSVLKETDCTACGACLGACPSSAIALLHERDEHSSSYLTLPWRGPDPWAVGQSATLANRRGDVLGSGRVTSVVPTQAGPQLVQVEVPSHLIWEARSLRRPRNSARAEREYLKSIEVDEKRNTDITLNGERRLVRDRIPLSVALYEIGQSRPEDMLICPDGSCGLCQVWVDGVKRLACQTPVHGRMSVKMEFSPEQLISAREGASGALCPCLGVSSQQVAERIHQSRLSSPDSALAVTHVGEGRCHGGLCGSAFKRLLAREGLDSNGWVDWRFPWSEWVLIPGSHER